ncbi:hypothetical protein H9K76_18480 [Diaphorobacter ruginosibacter]|uniref:Uncharacterized protein n=1 Tax=Diaphorobacter ruginosibacter TaxID=1715720 RepID=A0A7G9RLM9_9BURK|nr:hypothetical protein [Diaphorobacter ruginosibacter]QNN56504.1 hypothetical protein H9K76_18480 [Diaphorobacter ruginosibacter]
MDSIHPVMRDALNGFAPRSFNDDDIYIYDIQSRQIVESFGSASPTARAARYSGIPVKAGQSWCRGMQAKYMELS